MNIIADTHTHTLACDHAFSTINENAKAAKEKGIRVLCYTEHTPSLMGAPTYPHFYNLKAIPRYIDGVLVVRGAEINICDYDGKMDATDEMLNFLEWKIASMHTLCLDPGTKADHTRTWRAIAENPHINVIGHCGDGRYDFEHKEVIKAFADNGKIVEINSHSFDGSRINSDVNCPKIAALCAEYGVPLVVSSDAHHDTQIGVFKNSIKMLEDLKLPEELIINADYDRFMDTLHRLNGGLLRDE